jgi:hypothetical protein
MLAPRPARAARGAALLALALAACSADTARVEPLQWTKVGPVLPLSGALGFDAVANFTVSALKDGATTYLYYGGADTSGVGICPGINVAHWRIGVATSTDGVTFTRVAGDQTGGAIVDNGADGKFDSYLTYRPFVLKDGATWRMWYNGSTRPFNDCRIGATPSPARLADNRRIGYAESSDGLHWNKLYDGDGEGGSVLPLGPAGSIDAQQVGYVWVLKDGDQYKMYYSANDATNTWRVALAVSSDARHWTKVRGKGATGAVLDLGGTTANGSVATTFDVACAYQPTVVKERADLYRMWYRGCEAPAQGVGGPSGGTIGYAESNDGITWIKVNGGGPGGIALGKGAAGAFDSGGLTTPAVFLDGNTWDMYYAGFDTTGQFLAGLARAPKLP